MTTDTDTTTEAPALEDEAREQVEKHREEMEQIVPNKANMTWTVGKGQNEKKYVQRPLSYFGKMEFFALLGGAIDQMMQGEEGMTVTGMMHSIGQRPGATGGTFSINDFRDADVFIQAISKVLQYAPDFLEESYCIWLGVPRGERDLAKYLMSLPEDEGGLSDDDGLMIVQTFLDQNVTAIESFFTERLPKLFRRVQALSTKMRGDLGSGS